MPRILVIDDDPAVRGSVVAYLKRVGHEVLEAYDGKLAMRMIEDAGVDLVITDINMPEMDGIEVIRALRAASGGAPVIAMSGGGLFPKSLLLDSAKALGAMTTLAKPFDLPDLRRAVDAALGASADDSAES